MKLKIENYSFNKTSKQITFVNYESIRLDAILLIINVTNGIAIYDGGDSALIGTVSDNVLTLAYDTSAMSDSDELLIYYDDATNLSNSAEDEQLALIIKLLLQKAADNPIWYDVVNNALRITGAVTVSGTVAVSTVTDQTSMGGKPAYQITNDLSDAAWALTIRNLLTFT